MSIRIITVTGAAAAAADAGGGAAAAAHPYANSYALVRAAQSSHRSQQLLMATSKQQNQPSCPIHIQTHTQSETKNVRNKCLVRSGAWSPLTNVNYCDARIDA